MGYIDVEELVEELVTESHQYELFTSDQEKINEFVQTAKRLAHLEEEILDILGNRAIKEQRMLNKSQQDL